MATYEVTINDEHNKALAEVSKASGTSVQKIIEEYLNRNLADAKVDLVVNEYKNGSLSAMKAWKLSGLSFDEFNALAKE